MYRWIGKIFIVAKNGFLLGLLLLLSSCVEKLPYHDTGYGLLGVGFQVDNVTTYRLIRAVELRSSADDDFSIRLTEPPLNGELALSQPIPAGEYLIDLYMTKVVPVSGVTDPMRQQTEKLPEPVRINLKDGEIFLFPIGFTARQYKKADYVFCPVGWEELDSARLEAHRQKLETMENSSMWTITTK